MPWPNEEGNQEKRAEVFGNGPQKRQQQNRHTQEPKTRKEERRHRRIKNHPPRNNDVEAPDKANSKEKTKIAEGHVRALAGFGVGGEAGSGVKYPHCGHKFE